MSFKDIVTIVVIDILAYLILTKTLDLYLFKKFHPHLKNDFRGLTSERLLELLKVNDITFDLLSRLPLRRSIWTIFVNAIKVIPAGIYIVVFADHGYSYEKALMLFVILEVFLISTFSSMTYIELHYYITDLLHNQQKGNQLKSDELTNEILTNPESLSKEFWFTETVGLLCCTIFFVLQVWVLIDLPLLEISIVRKTITFFAGLFVLARVYFLYQNYFKRGVEKIYERFTLLGDHFQVESLSISSSKALATFELLFFRLVKTIRSRDEEIASWVMNENESSRLRTIGEVSAMIGHDTKGPIHAIEYSLAELQNNSDLSEETKKYLKYISDNTDRLKKLTTSLNVNMRETNQLGEASFLRAHTEVLSLLHYEFFPVEDTEFKIDQVVMGLKFKIGQSDLVHVLYNIYHNALRNMMENNTASLKIEVYIETKNKDDVLLCIQDYGVGICFEKYNELLEFNFSKVNEFRRGLGLKLVKKVLENYNGSIEAIPARSVSEGLSLRLLLPLATNPVVISQDV